MTTKASVSDNVTNPASHALIFTGTVLLASAPILLYHYGPRILLTYKSYQSRRRLRSLAQNASSQQSDTTTQDPPTVSGIYIHPVKSLRPVSLTSTSFDKHGLKSDRRLMIVRPNPPPLYGAFLDGEATHRFVTQRQCSKFATIQVSPPIQLDNGKIMMKLSCELTDEHVYVDVAPRSIQNLPMRYLAGVWGDTVRVADVGDEAAAFVAKVAMLEDASFGDVRVVAILEESVRRVEESYCPEEARVGFGSLPQSGLTDGFPVRFLLTIKLLYFLLLLYHSLFEYSTTFCAHHVIEFLSYQILIATESSLAELNKRLSEVIAVMSCYMQWSCFIISHGFHTEFETNPYSEKQKANTHVPLPSQHCHS
jgi:uncharacterized protein YcbX